MINLIIAEIKPFMAQLLTGKTFDQFMVMEAEVTTFTTFKIDGLMAKEYFTADELETLEGRRICKWAEIRPFILTLIKGKKLPVKFKIIFQLSQKNLEWLMENNQTGLTTADVGGLFMNIKYENQALTCITGTSIKTFTLDKSLEQIWDTTVQQFFKQHQIAYTNDY